MGGAPKFGAGGTWEHLPLCLALGVVAAIFKATQWVGDKTKMSEEFKKFQLNYLVVILFMKTADWLQGPYVYALYRGYGFDKKQIGQLFICGFAMSGFVGVWVGNMADKYGRKMGAVLFSVLYIGACICYHINDFHVLLLGRALAGVGTALLYTVFEAWYKSEHEKKGFSSDWMSSTFNKQTFGDAVLAILAGLVASYLADMYGDIGAFDASLFCLVCGGGFVVFTWGENKADKKTGQEDVGIIECLKTMYGSDNLEIGLCGLVQSLFGGSMYIFVFMWTPSLPDHYNPGVIFSCYMVAIMIGTCIFSELMKRGWSLSGIVCLVCGSAAVVLYIPALTEDPNIRLGSFILYEVIIGVWFPSYHSMRAEIVPDRGHATILSFYRLPLNLIVVFIIWNQSWMTTVQVFSACFVMLCVATLLMSEVHRRLQLKKSESKKLKTK